jgi:two-component sensor histidine kinase
MALHELMTNAVKYGALSVPAGSVAIRWTVRAGKDLVLRWEEKNGPRVAPPSRKGFGSRLIERSLAAELRGEVQLCHEPAGVVCTIRTPLGGEREPR